MSKPKPLAEIWVENEKRGKRLIRAYTLQLAGLVWAIWALAYRQGSWLGVVFALGLLIATEATLTTNTRLRAELMQAREDRLWE